ncbi:hypothetical protein BH708_10125 [Brachybacterium sp. P6-10-X1]|uniref:hypothetical protein n=1 Tax=Brachybacterium sp. P6-10-X1 TaxID=1903186 RepID=UPI000971903A|nr:hypothetical protein [Brachybacterium sp. P6-10-X1]APX33003.1 hypothetical protein BH708_10125 [Brachybacterium sp. P6-10-X1]
MTLHRFLERHRDELGAPVQIHHNRFGPGTVLVGVGIWLLCGAFLLLAPDLPVGGLVAVLSILALAVAAVLVLMLGEVVVVCERGLVLGPTGLFRRPFLVRYDQITPGSLVPVHRARRYTSTTGRKNRTAIVRNFEWVSRGIHFVGPAAGDALRGGGRPGIIATNHQRSVDGRWIWFLGTGSTAPETVTAQIAQASGRAGFSELARATATAPPRALSGRRADVARLLPGYPAPR